MQTGIRQHSSCPSAQKSRRTGSGLTWKWPDMEVACLSKNWQDLSLPVLLLLLLLLFGLGCVCERENDQVAGDLPSVFNNIQSGTQMAKMQSDL